jgi:hypothetical protein
MDPKEKTPGAQKNDVIIERTHRVVSRVWALAAVSIVMILTIGFIVIKIIGTPAKVIEIINDSITGMLKPNVKIEVVILNTIGELKKESKFVVLTTEITVNEKRSSIKKILWDKLSLGTTVVEMRVPGNKVQYIIPTAEIKFHLNEARSEVVIDIPSAILDEEFVDIQSDPSLIEVRTKIGWGRLQSHSGKQLEDQIRADLRSLVIEQGKKELLLDRARNNAEEAIRNLFEQVMKREKVVVTVRTRIN